MKNIIFIRNEHNYRRFINFLLFFLLLSIFSMLVSYYIGFRNIFVYLIWWMFFTGYHYFIYHNLNCPLSITPIMSFSSIILIIYSSGFLGSLHYGYYLIMIIGIFGLINIIINYKFNTLKYFIFQPSYLQIYYILSLLSFLQCIFLNKGFKGDDIHHWGLIINGMCHYHKLTGFPRLTIFDSYTLGSAIWGYFINRLSFYSFRIYLAHWSSLLCLSACFIPGLSLIERSKKISILPIIIFLIGFSFFSFYKIGNYYIYFGILALSLIIIPIFFNWYKSKKNAINNILFIQSFIIYFLVYSSLLIAPNLVGSSYRSIKPEIALFAIPAACLIAYIANPKLKMLLLIAPILTINYLYKRPGIFFSFAVMFSISVHQIFKQCEIFMFFSKVKKEYNKKKKIFYILFTFGVAFLILISPSIIWSKYCQSKKINMGNPDTKIEFNISFLKKCFSNNENNIFAATKNKYIKRLFNENIFSIEINKNGCLFFLFYIQKAWDIIFKSNLVTKNKAILNYVQANVYLILCQFFIFIIFMRNKRTSLILLPIILFVFSVIYIFALYVTYCYWFAGSQQSSVCPSFQRYASPMLKLFIMCILSIYFYYISFSKLTIKFISNTFLLIFSILYALSFDLSNHTYKLSEHIREVCAISSIPPNLNFINKKVLLCGFNDYNRLKFAAPFFMNYYYSSPSKTTYQSFYKRSKQYTKVNGFDYLIWIAEGDTASSNSINNTFQSIVNDISKLNRTCIFQYSNNKYNLIFQDNHFPTNILINSLFKEDFNHWIISGSNINNVRIENDNVIISGNNTLLKQSINLKSNNYYRISFNVLGNFSNNICSRLGSFVIKNTHRNSWDEINEYYYSALDTNVFFVVYGSKKGARFNSIKIIDMGQKGRNN